MNRLSRTTSLVAAVALLAGCSWSAGDSTGPESVDRLPRPPASSTTVATTTMATTTTLSATQQDCERQQLATKSYSPAQGDGTEFVDELRRRGQIRVGVDENTLGLASLDEDGEIKGFEVDLAQAIAGRLFGAASVPESVVLVPLTTDQKTDFVRDHRVDMTISAISMSCSRWNDVDFSAEYYTTHQDFLVRSGSPIDQLADLDGRSVCVTSRSSSATILAKANPRANLVVVPDRTGCLLKLQDGDVDAYFGHDTFLSGMLPQDPTMVIRSLSEDIPVSHYGIAIAKGRRDLVRLVNGVLESMHADGSWDALARDLEHTLPELPRAVQPVPQYRDAP